MKLSQQDLETIKNGVRAGTRPSQPRRFTAPVYAQSQPEQSGSSGSSGSNSATVFLGAFATMLSLATIFGIWSLMNKDNSNELYAQQPPQSYTQPYSEPESYDLRPSIDAQTEKRIGALEDGYKELMHRTHVLGLQANQNTSINKEADRQFHKGQRVNRYVYVEGSPWKLDKRPDNIRFSQKDLDRIHEFVKKP